MGGPGKRRRARARQAVDLPDLCGPFDGGRIQHALPQNLAKGQTGLSVAFDLPTQTGYDPDHELARGEVGKVGVPIAISATCGRCSRTSRSPR